MYNMYNPMQSRIDNLIQQKNMIDQQIQQLHQYMDSTQINNYQSPNLYSQNMAANNYDFSGKWITDESQVNIPNTSGKPLILFDSNNPIFYVKNTDNSYKKYKFEEVVSDESVANDSTRLDELEKKMNLILNKLDKRESSNQSRNYSKNKKEASQ